MLIVVDMQDGQIGVFFKVSHNLFENISLVVAMGSQKTEKKNY